MSLAVIWLGGVRLAAQTFSFTSFAGSASEIGSVDGVGGNALLTAYQLAIDAQGNIYFTDFMGHTVRRIAPNGLVTTVAGRTGEAGSTDGAMAAARFRNPDGLAFDAAGNLYVGDSGNHVLRRISSGIVTTVAGGIGVEDQVDGVGPDARFGSLSRFAVDGAGNVLLCDTRHAVLVRKVTPAGSVTTLLRSGEVQSAGASSYFEPSGLAFDAVGNLFVSDSGGHTIRRLAPSGDLSVAAGVPGVSGSADGAGAVARLSYPWGLARAPNGDMFFSDHWWKTLRRLSPDGTVTTVAGQPDTPGRPPLQDGIAGNARFFSARSLAFDAGGALYVTDGYSSVIRRGELTTQPAPPILTVSPGSEKGSYRAVGARGGTTFSASANGAAPLIYQWLKDQSPIAGATGATHSILAASQTDEGAYAVRVSNVAGSFTSQAVTLRVFTPAFEAFAERRRVPGGSFLWGIASGGGQLVAVGTGGRILSSPDGREWTVRESGTSDWLVGVAYGAGQFVAVGDHGTILTSRDTVSWTRAAASGTTQRLNNVAFSDAFGRRRFVAVGEAGTIVTSPDARTWMPVDSGVGTWLRGLVWVPYVPMSPGISGDEGSGRFYASGQGGLVLQSGTGDEWSRPYGFPPAELGGRDVEGLAPGPVGIGQDGIIVSLQRSVMTSKSVVRLPDGRLVALGVVTTRWTTDNLGLQARFRGIVRAADAFFATGEGGIVAAAPSPAGPWSFIPSGTQANLVNGTYHGNSLFVVGENETVLESQPLFPSRLINLATRGHVESSASPLISGIVIRGAVPKMVLLRAAGPALGGLGVPDFLAAPVLTLIDAEGRVLAVNAGWSAGAHAAEIAAAGRAAGAFAFAEGSADAAILTSLAPGAYTAVVTGGEGAAGIALVEAYDVEPGGGQGAVAVNLSTRGRVGAGDARMVGGFVIGGAASRRVLIRAVGPSLENFGLSGLLAEPTIELFRALPGYTDFRAAAGAWSQQAERDGLASAAILSGAFPLDEDSADAAMLVELLPGAYTFLVSGRSVGTGVALVEVYDLP